MKFIFFIIFLIFTPIFYTFSNGDKTTIFIKKNKIQESLYKVGEYIFKLKKGASQKDLEALLSDYKYSQVDPLGLDMYMVRFSDGTSYEEAQEIVKSNPHILLRVEQNQVYQLIQ
jgi:hypothetical protein